MTPAEPGRRRLSMSQATLVSLGSQGISAVATLVATPYLVDRVGVAAYGILLATAVLTGQLGPLQLGIPSAAMRMLGEARGRGDEQRRAAVLRSLLWLGIGSMVVVAAGFLAIAPWAWRHSFAGGDELLAQALAAIPAATVLAAAQPLIGIGQAALIGDERFGVLSTIRAVVGVGRTVVTVAAVALGFGVVGALWAQAATDLLTAAWMAVSARPGRAVPAQRHAVGIATRQLMVLGLPFAGIDVLNAILQDGEKLVIGLTQSAVDLTYYTVPFTAAMRVTLLTGAILSVLVPRISATAAGGDHVAAGVLTHRVTRVTVVAMMCVLAPLIAVTPELLTLWVGPEFGARAGLSTRLIFVGLFAITAATAAHAALRAVGRPATLAVLYGAESVLHLALVFYAVGRWGITGAALAWLVRAALDAVAQRFLAARALRTSIGPWREYFVPLAALSGFVAACQLLGPAAPWPLRAVAGVAIAAAAAAWLLAREDRAMVGRALAPALARLRGARA